MVNDVRISPTIAITPFLSPKPGAHAWHALPGPAQLMMFIPLVPPCVCEGKIDVGRKALDFKGDFRYSTILVAAGVMRSKVGRRRRKVGVAVEALEW